MDLPVKGKAKTKYTRRSSLQNACIGAVDGSKKLVRKRETSQSNSVLANGSIRMCASQ